MLHGLGCRTKPHGNGRRLGPSHARIHSERRHRRLPAPAQKALASYQSTYTRGFSPTRFGHSWRSMQ